MTTSPALVMNVSANRLRPLACDAQLLRAVTPIIARECGWSRGAMLAETKLNWRMRLALDSPTVEEASWLA